jgi:ABC-2 type transport system ATP-binding protein
MTRIRIEGSYDAAAAREAISAVEGARVIGGAETGGDGSSLFTVESSSEADIRNALATGLVESGVPLLEIYSEELSLEDIFIELVTEEDGE